MPNAGYSQQVLLAKIRITLDFELETTRIFVQVAPKQGVEVEIVHCHHRSCPCSVVLC